MVIVGASFKLWLSLVVVVVYGVDGLVIQDRRGVDIDIYIQPGGLTRLEKPSDQPRRKKIKENTKQKGRNKRQTVKALHNKSSRIFPR